MTDAANPYEPPHGPVDQKSTSSERCSRLLSIFRRRSTIEQFLDGRRLWHCGVVFRLDATDPLTVVASLPLAVDDEEHIQRNIREARRMFAELLTIHPELFDPLRGRQLTISMISTYEDLNTELRREIISTDEWLRDLQAQQEHDM